MDSEVFKKVVDLVKSQVGLLDVVNMFGLGPKKSGSGYFLSCPFHAEKTPSLSLDANKNLWKCFGCDASGDQITFVQMMLSGNKSNFREALDWLIENFNLLSPDYFAYIAEREKGGDERGKSASDEKTLAPPRSPEEIQRMRIMESDLRAKAILLGDTTFTESNDRVYQTLLDYFELEETELEDLSKRDCHPEWAEKMLYRSLPVARSKRIEIAEEIADHLGFADDQNDMMPPGFFRINGGKETGRICMGGDRYGLRLFQMDKTEKGWRKSFAPNGIVLPIHGMLIPHRNRLGHIISLKIRNQSFPEKRMIDLMTPPEETKKKKPKNYNASSVSEDDNHAWQINVPFRVNKLTPEKQEQFYQYKENWLPKYLFVSSYEQRALTGVHFGNYENLKNFYLREKFSPHWIVTEGELKADIISNRLQIPCLGLPGVTGNHFELFWEIGAFGQFNAAPEEVGEILDKALINWENWETERGNWLDYKRLHYQERAYARIEDYVNSKINELSVKQIEVLREKELLLYPVDESDRELLHNNFKAPANAASLTNVLLFALDEDDNISVNRALHRLGWMCLKLGITPIRIRWQKTNGKGMDDLLQNQGEWWTVRLADNL